jgi:DNA-binding XRE family transcriptional regulator
MAVKDRGDQLLDAPYDAQMRELVNEIAGDEIAQVARALRETLAGDAHGAARYVYHYRRLARALLSAAAARRPQALVVGASGHVELAEPSGAHVSWLETALDQSAAGAPFSRWTAVLGVDDGVALHALASLRGLVPDATALQPPAGARVFRLDELQLRRFLRSVRRDLDVEEPALERIQTVFDLSRTELAHLFGVSRQAISGWIESGVPGERQAKVATVSSIADLLERKLKPARVAGIARRAAPAYGGKTMLELVAEDRHDELLETTRRSFDWATAA